jgi:hypothetical protein
MTVTAIQIGLDPDVIDYSSSDFAQFPGLSKEQLRAANDDNVAALRAAGYHVDNCLIDFGDAGADKARQWLEAKRYDAVLIGAGVRLVAATRCCSRPSSMPHTSASPIAASSSTAQPSPPPTRFVVGTRTRRRWRDDRS